MNQTKKQLKGQFGFIYLHLFLFIYIYGFDIKSVKIASIKFILEMLNDAK